MLSAPILGKSKMVVLGVLVVLLALDAPESPEVAKALECLWRPW
jgi:hypothetical protein